LRNCPYSSVGRALPW